MAVLTADRTLKRRGGPGQLVKLPVYRTTTIYKGSQVSVNATGYAIASTDTAGTKFVGIATEKVVNAGSDGDKFIRVETGREYLLPATSITQAMVGDTVFVVDSGEVDDLAGVSDGITVGNITEFVSITSAWVFCGLSSTVIPVAGVTSSATELNYIDGSVPGTVVASKAVVVDANKDISAFRDVTLRHAVSTGKWTATTTEAAALAIGAGGATDPAFQVDASTGSQKSGLKVTGGATTGTVAVACISNGANVALTVNGKGTGTIGIGSVSTGAVTITPATTVTGALTPSGGVAKAGGATFDHKPYNLATWQPIAATSGTDSACTNNTAYCGSIQVPGNCTITGIGYLIGSVGGTDKVVVSLHDASGALLANSDLVGATVGSPANVQQVAFTGAYPAVGPATYFIALTFNGTTAKFRTVPAHCQAGVMGNSVTQTFGTAANFTAPTTFTADKVPVAFVY
jgi:hypothetical protein